MWYDILSMSSDGNSPATAATAEVHLIDALPYVFRAYFSMPTTLTDRSGAPCGATRGFLDFLVRYLAGERPESIAVAFDESLTTSFRNEIYPAYKAQREPPPAELLAQLDDCRRGAEALGLACLSDPRYEADDLVATLCSRSREAGRRVVVVTIDKDLSQLVDEQVELYDYARGRRYDPAAVLERFGVRPDQIADYLGLAGDAVDNIPGVKGVGPKTAAALLQHFDSMDDIYERLEEVSSLAVRGAKSLAAKLEPCREMAFLSRTLATVARDAPLSLGVDDLAWRGARREQLEPLLEHLGIPRLSSRIQRWIGASQRGD